MLVSIVCDIFWRGWFINICFSSIPYTPSFFKNDRLVTITFSFRDKWIYIWPNVLQKYVICHFWSILHKFALDFRPNYHSLLVVDIFVTLHFYKILDMIWSIHSLHTGPPSGEVGECPSSSPTHIYSIPAIYILFSESKKQILIWKFVHIPMKLNVSMV